MARYRNAINSDKRTNSASRRAMKGKLKVVRIHCPHCGHHKALSSVNKTKCSRCKLEVKNG